MLSNKPSATGARPRVIKLRAKGLTYRQIAEECAISIQRVHKILQDERAKAAKESA